MDVKRNRTTIKLRQGNGEVLLIKLFKRTRQSIAVRDKI